jgi:K+-transporting ATPase ATPase C chain
MDLLRPALVVLALLSALTGFVYPIVTTGLAYAIFPGQASGSLVRHDGRVVGSALIGQPFDDPRFFWSRPSATGRHPYDAAASTGSNLGPLNPGLHDAVRARVEAWRAADPAAPAPPVDLVTASGSGLDPHVSPAAALAQVARVARARGLPEDRVRALVEARVERRTLGLLGEPRVNVLLLNLDLERAGSGGS